MKLKQVILLVIILILLPLAAPSEEKRFSIPLENSPSLGPESAPVTIIEFIDFQ